MATVGEWKRSGVQATGSAGGRLSVGGVLEKERLEGGGSLGMAGLYKHPVSLPRLLHHSYNEWTSSEGETLRWLHTRLTSAPHRSDCSRVLTRSNLLHQKL